MTMNRRNILKVAGALMALPTAAIKAMSGPGSKAGRHRSGTAHSAKSQHIRPAVLTAGESHAVWLYFEGVRVCEVTGAGDLSCGVIEVPSEDTCRRFALSDIVSAKLSGKFTCGGLAEVNEAYSSGREVHFVLSFCGEPIEAFGHVTGYIIGSGEVMDGLNLSWRMK